MATPQPKDASTLFSDLPSEIHALIFSFLSLKQCGECIRVCRTWRDYLAKWAATTTTTTAGRPRTLALRSGQLEAIPAPLVYLGPFVHTIEIRGSPYATISYEVFAQLARLGLPCLRSLHITPGIGDAQEPESVVQALRLVGQNLQRLQVSRGSRHSNAVLLLLECCPQLTQLWYSDTWMSDLALSNSYPTDTPFRNLHYLALGRAYTTEDMLVLVRRSPHLRYLQFRGTSPARECRILPVLEACPTLECVHCFLRDSTLQLNQDLWRQDGPSADTGIGRERQLREVHSDVLPSTWHEWLDVMDRYSTTLRHLHLRAMPYFSRQPTALMVAHPTHWRVPERLGTIGFEYRSDELEPYTAFTDTFLRPILDGCHQLTDVSIITFLFPPPEFMWDRVARLSQLTHLCIKNKHDTGAPMAHLLASIARRHVPLETFTYQGQWFERAGPQGPPPAVFSALARIRTLRHITVDAEHEGHISKNEMSRCLASLRRLPHLQSLSFVRVSGFQSEQAFRSLRKITALTSVSFEYCRSLDEPGLRALCDRQPCLEKMCIVYCTIQPSGRPTSVEEPWIRYAKRMIPHVVNQGTRYAHS